MNPNSEMVAVLDFGSQYTQLIARRIRESGVYCEILRFDTSAAVLRQKRVRAVILSGGPASVFWEKSPVCDPAVFEMAVPVLGICYGLQLMSKLLNGAIASSPHREFGHAALHVVKPGSLFDGLPAQLTVWMSHGDKVTRMPPDFEILARTDNSPLACIAHRTHPFYGVQFHPEVAHTPMGKQILDNFLFRVAGLAPSWNMHSFIEQSLADIRKQVGNGKVLLGLSGGVDSSVLAVLLHRAIGKKLACVFVDNGLLRKDEARQVVDTFKKRLGIPLIHLDAGAGFIKKLAGVTDPEKKRKIIGKEFIRVFEAQAKKLKGIEFLAQGTLYPDVIESRSAFGGPSATIKTHHNVGGLPNRMKLKLIEPFKELFKDEVRRVGAELDVPDEILNRHPFPGPGLAVRVLGRIEKTRLDILREADAIYIGEMKKAGLYNSVWQAFAVLLPVQTVGVMGDQRTYEHVIALRAVHSTDGMTASWVKFPHEFLEIVSSRIVNEVRGVNRVVYDISSKPPSTIEWE